MPQLLIRGINPKQVCEISEELVRELADICECGTDNFMLECQHTTSIIDGKIVDSYPFIEVGWFERGQETRDQFAKAITKHVMSLGIPEVEVAFVTYRENSYYVNGERCFK
ncbi:DUF1904 family protein [Bacillus sp. 165]|uniref:DUF1904 family protein n=1 Tax=Bacillus sp. 165 TaxID=1529117 RepID=UPI001ADBF5EF|nr:DUF1904 family protein [Bacillus sp. 165]MBO9128766.1 DUF1904 family protein [Bacillus sp. 165]